MPQYTPFVRQSTNAASASSLSATAPSAHLEEVSDGQGGLLGRQEIHGANGEGEVGVDRQGQGMGERVSVWAWLCGREMSEDARKTARLVFKARMLALMYLVVVVWMVMVLWGSLGKHT
ncbi:hypothetical protein PG993_010171 [Apiospora rasikravindrae]|uniref:Uncharacterized protein n=1 Tax=Apiospora rasikravindrae TaxID=990691 RepID=A0ABR1SLH3_9PEZI